MRVGTSSTSAGRKNILLTLWRGGAYFYTGHAWRANAAKVDVPPPEAGDVTPGELPLAVVRPRHNGPCSVTRRHTANAFMSAGLGDFCARP